VLENGRRWRMAIAGEWQSLENGRRWRMVIAGEWEALETGRRWSHWNFATGTNFSTRPQQWPTDEL
jgi:hypothetical protein